MLIFIASDLDSFHVCFGIILPFRFQLTLTAKYPLLSVGSLTCWEEKQVTLNYFIYYTTIYMTNRYLSRQHLCTNTT